MLLPQSEQIADKKASVSALVLVNTFPLFGVFALGWRAFDVVILYWFENVIIGLVTALKIIACTPDPEYYDLGDLDERGPGELTYEQKIAEAEEFQEKFGMSGATAWHLSKLFFLPFFLVHYGGFCFVHGGFVCVLLGGDGPFGEAPLSPVKPAVEALSQTGIQVCIVALAISHMISFFLNYLRAGEYRRTLPTTLMMQPYGRVIVLHIAILLSGFLTFLLGSPIWLLVLLVVGKTLLDLKFHLIEYALTSEHSEDTASAV